MPCGSRSRACAAIRCTTSRRRARPPRAGAAGQDQEHPPAGLDRPQLDAPIVERVHRRRLEHGKDRVVAAQLAADRRQQVRVGPPPARRGRAGTCCRDSCAPTAGRRRVPPRDRTARRGSARRCRHHLHRLAVVLGGFAGTSGVADHLAERIVGAEQLAREPLVDDRHARRGRRHFFLSANSRLRTIGRLSARK